MEPENSTISEQSQTQQKIPAPSHIDKRSKIFLIIICVFFCLASGGIAFNYFRPCVIWPCLIDYGTLPPTILDSTPSAALIPEGTAAWKTYRNEEYGFEFEYPAMWSLNEKNDDYEMYLSLGTPADATFSPEESIDYVGDALIEIKMTKVSTPTTIDTILETQEALPPEAHIGFGVSWPFDYAINLQTIGTLNGVRETIESDFTYDTFRFLHDRPDGQYLFHVQLAIFKPSENNSTQLTNDFDHILSTFRFLDEIDTATIDELFAHYTIPVNNPAVEVCYSGPLIDEKLTKECLQFYGNGTVYRKNFNLDNSLIEQEEVTNIDPQEVSKKVNGYYQELIGGEFNQWLKGKEGVPVSGGVMDSLAIHSDDSLDSISSHTITTTFVWGGDYSEESIRLQEIFDDLKTYKPSN